MQGFVQFKTADLATEEKNRLREFFASANDTLKYLGKQMGLFADVVQPPIPHEVTSLVQEREKARQQKNFKLADQKRKEIHDRGFIVEDTPTGPVVRPK